MKTKIICLFAILSMIMLNGCMEEPVSHAPVSERVVPAIITSITIIPNFNVFNLDLSCKSWDDYGNYSSQKISIPFIEVIDYNIHLISEDKRYNKNYIELRRYYFPETRIWSMDYENYISRLINVTGIEAKCNIGNPFSFNYTYYDGSNMIKKDKFSCVSIYDYQFRCIKRLDGWKCSTFKNMEQVPPIYDSNSMVIECMEDRIRENFG